MYNHLFSPGVVTPAGLPEEAITWPLSPGAHHVYFQKHTYFQAYKVFTLYYPAKLRKYTVAACWDFFFTTEKKIHWNLERVQANSKNTGFNINTISAYTSEH